MAKKSRKQPNPRRSVEAARKKTERRNPHRVPRRAGDRSRVDNQKSDGSTPELIALLHYFRLVSQRINQRFLRIYISSLRVLVGHYVKGGFYCLDGRIGKF